MVAGNIIQTSVVDTRVDNRRLADKVENLVGFIRTVGLKEYLVMRVYIINVAILVGCSRHDGSIVIEHALVYRNLPNGVFGSYAHMVVLLS